MVTAANDTSVARGFHPSFFFWLAMVIAGFIFGGFALTYWQPMLAGVLGPMPPIVHLHGLFFFGWIVLLVVQASLVNVRHVALHRSVGTFGIAMATGLLIVGTVLQLLSGRNSPSDSPGYYDFAYLGDTALVMFGVLFTLAIRNVRKPDNHRRLMIFATIPLLPPGINRLYMVPLGLIEPPVLATYLTMDALIAAIFLYDWRKLGSVSHVSLFAAAMIVLVQLLHAPVVGSEAFAAFCDYIHGLARYR